MPKEITKMWLMVKIDGASIAVRQVYIDDNTGAVAYGEAVELKQNEKSQLENVARSLAKRLESV
jgi:hypothetical protein